MSLIAQIAVFLGATVLVIPLFRRLRLSSILGYLAAGVVIGPWGLRIVQDTEGVMHIAEFGVVLLLFVIGLELQPSRLRAMRKAVFGVGLAQVVVTTAVLTLIALALGLPSNAALVTAFALSLSSTPLVLQLLAERQQLNTHYGRSSFAILLFQDIAVMPMLAILPLLGGEQQTLTQTLLSGGKGLAVLAVVDLRRPLPAAPGPAHRGGDEGQRSIHRGRPVRRPRHRAARRRRRNVDGARRLRRRAPARRQRVPS